MTAGRDHRPRCSAWIVLAVVAAGAVLADGCALTHHERAPEIQELAFRYPPPAAGGAPPLDAAIKVRRFSALSPYNGTAMYFERGAYGIGSFNYERWVTSPANQVTGLLYRDLAAAHAFRAVFTDLSTEQPAFELEGTVVECVMTGAKGSRRARLVVSVSLVDSRASTGRREVVLQRRFEASEPLENGSAEQMAAGMSTAMGRVSEAIRSAVEAACRKALG